MRYRATINGREVEAKAFYSIADERCERFHAMVELDGHTKLVIDRPPMLKSDAAVERAATFLESLGFERIED